MSGAGIAEYRAQGLIQLVRDGCRKEGIAAMAVAMVTPIT